MFWRELELFQLAIPILWPKLSKTCGIVGERTETYCRVRYHHQGPVNWTASLDFYAKLLSVHMQIPNTVASSLVNYCFINLNRLRAEPVATGIIKLSSTPISGASASAIVADVADMADSLGVSFMPQTPRPNDVGPQWRGICLNPKP